MRTLNFAKRNFKEIIRDPLSIIFAVILPLFLLFIFQQFDIPTDNYKIENFTPGIIIFSFSFITLFTAMLISKDRSTSLLIRLGISPMKPMDYIFGYIISIIIFMTKQFNRDGRKRIPFWSYVTTKGKVKSAFAPYDPYFSFEKFEGQIISLIRMAIMSDHPENLASYCGGTLNPYFRDIIEMTYMQAMTVQDIHMEGSHLCMTLRTWWINYSEKNGRVNRCGDC